MHFRKNSNHLTNSSALTQPLSLFTNKVLGYAPSFSLSGTHVFLGYIIIGGSVKPVAETHDKTVWVFPFSEADRAYTCLFPSSATTLFGLNTIVTPVSSQLKICIGLNTKFSFPYKAPSLPKKSAMVSLLPERAQQ